MGPKGRDVPISDIAAPLIPQAGVESGRGTNDGPALQAGSRVSAENVVAVAAEDSGAMRRYCNNDTCLNGNHTGRDFRYTHPAI